jgi:HD-GYP domain-containing protein (c-di-GMP phosphodiesterase class II)
MMALAIPLEARILMVVDSYIAMTDDRVYRKARNHEEVVEEIKSLSGKQYDPKVVEVFLELIESENKPIKG